MRGWGRSRSETIFLSFFLGFVLSFFLRVASPDSGVQREIYSGVILVVGKMGVRGRAAGHGCEAGYREFG